MSTPFTNGIYTVIAQNDTAVTVRFSEKEHPVFQAHFPQKPLLPGFLQIDVFAEILGVTVTEISSAKFMNIISPGEVVVYRYKKNGSKLRLELFNQKEALISDIRLCFE